MSLRVTLVTPPTFVAPRSLSYYGAVPPLGAAYVAGAIRAAGHDLQVIDATGEGLDQLRPHRTAVAPLLVLGLDVREIVARIDARADVVAISNLFLHEWAFLQELLRELRTKVPRALTVLGGETPTAMWDVMLPSCPELDVCVLGEGEATITELLSAVERGAPLEGVPGLALRSPAGAVTTGRSGRIRAIDSIAWPAWDLFPLERYLERRLASGVDRGRSMPMLTSRGCPFQCTFCSAPEMWTTRYAAREPEKVADEIEHYVRRYRVENIDFNDLTAVLTKEWIMKFCQVVQRRGLAVTWQLPSGTRSEAIDRESAEALFASGCRNFAYAPESGSARVLREVRKKVNLDSMLDSMRSALASGMRLHANVIVGIPQEERADLWNTYKLILRMAASGVHTIAVMAFTPYPGSEEYRRLRASGAIEFDDGYLYGALLRAPLARSYHPRFSARQLRFAQLFFLLSFFAVQYLVRPWRLFGVAWNMLRGRQDSVLEKFLVAKLKRRAPAGQLPPSAK